MNFTSKKCRKNKEEETSKEEERRQKKVRMNAQGQQPNGTTCNHFTGFAC